jgi:pimeloyl-ACP methyl ester carboxylesterase
VPFVDNKGVRIHWDEVGSGTPMLLIMGRGYSSRMWYPVIEDLAAKHRLVFFDNRGAGQTDTPPSWTIDDMVSDAAAVLDAAGIEKAHVYGVSLGGGLAMEFALQHPDRVDGLILGCTAIKAPDFPKLGARVVTLLGKLIVDQIRTGGFGPACPPADRAEAKKVLAGEPKNREGRKQQGVALGGYVTSREKVATITAPTLVLHGDSDQIVPVSMGRDIHATIKGSRYIEYPGAGHNYVVAARAKSSKDVGDFLEELDSRRGRRSGDARRTETV